MEGSEAVQQRQAQADAEAFNVEVRQVISAQRQQIAVLEKQAQQLANEAAAEQRYSAGLVEGDKASQLARLQQEHAQVSASLEAEGRRALALAERLEAAEARQLELHASAKALEQRERAKAKGKKGPMRLKVQRCLSAVDERDAEAAKLREEINHRRQARLSFLKKLRVIETELEEARAERQRLEGGIRTAASKRDAAIQYARQVEGQSERHKHARAMQRSQLSSQQAAIEKQSRLVRSKLRGSAASSVNAATNGAAALQKLRAKRAAWPPPADKSNVLARLGFVSPPQSHSEALQILSTLMHAPPDVTVMMEKLAAEDREQAARTGALEGKRRELAAEEEKLERMRLEAERLEATGGVDSAEHHQLRQQLTEMQAQGKAIAQAEERHAAILEHLGAIANALLVQLGEPSLPHSAERAGLADGVSSAVAAIKRRLDALADAAAGGASGPEGGAA